MSGSARVVALLVCLAWALPTSSATAANCGGAVPCQCGDVITTDYAMSADLGPCAGHGLVVKSHVVLDCRGFKVVGMGDGSEQYGIYLNGDTGAEVTGVTVQNCEVTRFLRGIRLRAAQQSLIVDNYSHDNGDPVGHVGYGIDVAVGAKNNLLQGNTIARNADEGVHFGSDTGPNQFVDNVLSDNFREQIYVLASDGNTFLGNTTSGAGSNSLYLKDSKDNYLEGNTFRDRTTKVIGDSTGNAFVDDVFVNSMLQFSVYSASPDRIPTDNTVAGGTMNNTGTCLRFTNTTGNVVSDMSLLGCGTPLMSEGTSTEPSSNTIVGMTVDASTLAVDANSTLAVGGWLTVHVQDLAGAAVGGARVQALDATGNSVFDLVTDADGQIPPQTLLQYVRTGSSSSVRAPHVLSVSKAGYQPTSQVIQASPAIDMSVVLSPSGQSGGGAGGTGDDVGGGTFFDDFDRADAAAPGNGWVEALGHVVVAGTQLQTGGVKGNNIAVQPSLVGAVQRVEADFVSPDNSTSPRLGVVVRFRDPQNYYLFYWKIGGGGALRISKFVNGVETVLGQTPISNPERNAVFHLAGHADGPSLTLELDGVAEVSASDPTFTSGSAGVLLGSKSTKPYRADNFSASLD